MLACAKSVPLLDARMRAGHWDKAVHKSLELHGRTVGLVGLGAIGLRFARMADAMGMNVLGFDPYAKELPSFVRPADLDALWKAADVISLHCPLTEENRNLLDAKTLARCKRGVIVVNTARGGLIDENALLDAVRSGHVRAAGLDSFAVEPMTAAHPIHGKARITLSPHVAKESIPSGVRDCEACGSSGLVASTPRFSVWRLLGEGTDELAAVESSRCRSLASIMLGRRLRGGCSGDQRRHGRGRAAPQH